MAAETKDTYVDVGPFTSLPPQQQRQGTNSSSSGTAVNTPATMLSALCWALLSPLTLGEASPQPEADHHVYGPLVPRNHGIAAPRHAHLHAQRRAVNSSVANTMLYGRNDMEPDDRNPDGTPYGPLSYVPGCFYCPTVDDMALEGRALLDSLTTEKMKTYMRKDIDDTLTNQCVFYTSSLTAPSPQYLSRGAAEFSCRKGKMSIWHLWPNKAMERAELQYRDFYGIFEPGWLNSIVPLPKINGVPATIVYFENMSEAIAQSCKGEVVIITQSPRNMKQYVDGSRGENIWKNKERPALEMLWRKKVVTKFYVVDYNNMDDAYEFNIVTSTLTTGIRVSANVLVSRGELDKRADCSSSGLDALSAMPGDPFSDSYSKFG